MSATDNDETRGSSPPDGTSLEFLINKVRVLTLKNQELESALELANRKLAFYEGFDESIQDAIAHSLQVAFDIRLKTERQAKDILEEARRDEADLREQVQKLIAERDSLVAEQASLSKTVDGVGNQRSVEALWPGTQANERSQLVVDVQALENRLKSIRRDLESLSTDIPQEVRADGGETGSQVVGKASPTPTRAASVDWQTVVPQAVDMKPPAPEFEPEYPFDGQAAQLSGEVELVVSPVHSFPKLVEFERALQNLREVKNFYVRDFRYGVATLLIKLSSPELREELPARLEALPGWNLAVLSCSPHRIETKVEA